jgi:hypothetical protein
MADASERVFGHLIFHPRLGVSWLLFSVVGVIAALIAIDTDHPPVAPLTAAPVRVQTSPTTATATPQATRRSRKRTHKQQQQPAVVQPPSAPIPQPKPVPEWKPRSIGDITWIAVYAGYIAWSLYWGVPACIWLMIQLLKQAMTSWSSALAGWASFLIGVWPALIFIFVMFVGGFFYSVLGGGAAHFFRFWWKLCHPAQPQQQRYPQPQVQQQPAPQLQYASEPSKAATPVQTSSQPMLFPSEAPLPDVEQRLRKLNDLVDGRLITPVEYAERRARILDEMLGGQPVAPVPMNSREPNRSGPITEH